MNQPSLFETPWHVENIDECEFYHTIDLPKYGVIQGCWDLRENIDAYLGNFDFSGKTALDVGTAGGLLTFYMENKGAKVTSFDLSSGQLWNIVPYIHPEYNLMEKRNGFIFTAERFKKGYWFSHKALGSQAQCHYGNIYNISQDLGVFDVAVMGTIISHLRDPIQALFSVSLRVKDYIILANPTMDTKDPIALWMPDSNTQSPLAAWWAFSHTCLERMFNVIGFEVETITKSQHLCEVSTKGKYSDEITTIVARRKYSSPVEITPDF